MVFDPDSREVKRLSKNIEITVYDYVHAADDKADALAVLRGAFEGTAFAIEVMLEAYAKGEVDLNVDFFLVRPEYDDD